MWIEPKYSSARVVLFNGNDRTRGIIINCLHRIGVRHMHFCDDLANVLSCNEAFSAHISVVELPADAEAQQLLITAIENRPNMEKPPTVMVITADARRSSIARLADNGVSTIVLKPYSFRTFADRFAHELKIKGKQDLSDTSRYGVEFITPPIAAPQPPGLPQAVQRKISAA